VPALALVIAACGASRPPAPWIEEDFQPHATAPARPPAPAEAPDAAVAAAPVAAAVPDGPRAIAGRIAVLLPLSGSHASLGNELRAAIRIAGADRTGVDWQWLDTAGDEAQAAAMVDRAADGGAAAILGPVGIRESAAAARRAAERRIPIALLGPADGADPVAGVFRVVTSPADEARAAARLAAELDYVTVAVLAPRDEVGTAMAEAFVQAAGDAGLTVAASGSYDPAARSLEPEVKAFLNLVPATNPRLRAHLRRHGRAGWQTFSPDIPFGLLYIPDQADRAALVAAYLPYVGVEVRTREIMDPLMLRRKHRGRIPQVVQLVGSSGWNRPGLLPRGGSAVDGAIIVDVHAGELDAGSDLAARYRDATGRILSSAAAQAHDATLLVAAAVAQAGTGEPRAAMRAALARGHLDTGHCGPAHVAADGELVRAAVFLEVDGDAIVLAPY
jgi:ABC-type branched-subunit amino acid transport system substrate-binding protein